MRVVIVHPVYGVFTGHAWGLAFWSLLDAGGQTHVPTFDDAKSAQEFVDTWQSSPELDKKDLTFHTVNDDHDAVDGLILAASGLEKEAEPLLLNEAALYREYGGVLN